MIEVSLVQLAAPILAGGLHPNVAPQGCQKPYGVYSEVVSPTENTLSDGVPIQQSIFQIDVWAPSYAAAKAAGEGLSDAISQAFDNDVLTGVQRSRRGRYDPDTKLHGFTYEFSFWYH